MKKRILPLFPMIVLLASAAALTGAAPGPDFDVAEYSGQVVLVDFWASWCKPCKESMPWLSQLQRTHGADGLQVIAVNMDRELDAAAQMLAELDEGIVVVHDPEGKLAQAYELEGMPSSFVYDRSGELVATHVGFLAADRAAKEAELEKLLAAAAKEADDEEN